MQRVRIGLTGLAFVFVLVLLGTVFTRASDEDPITANAIEMQRLPGAVAAEDQAEAKEPLAELGIAPGAGDNASKNAAETANRQQGQP
jgi:hypothetical protein